MVTEEIKTLFRKANRQVDNKIWREGKLWTKQNRRSRGEERRGGHIQGKRRDKDLGGAGRRQSAPPSLSPWLNADLFKRIVHRLANLPAASTAEHHGANVMRVVTLPAYVARESCSAPSWRMNPFTPLRTHRPPSGHLLQGNQRLTHWKTPQKPISEWNVYIFWWSCLFLVCHESSKIESWSRGCHLAVDEYYNNIISSPKLEAKAATVYDSLKRKGEICHFYYIRAEVK